MQNFKLISTPIYYVNDKPHLGHAYTTFIADMLKKYYSLQGEEVFLLTGTDEHGQKIAQSALKHNLSPLEYASNVSRLFKNQWDYFKIDYNHFVRTTDSQHKEAVQKAFEKMYQKGDIYKGMYQGSYCVSCESFVTTTHCPDCNRESTLVEEESYFFKLSNYQDRLLDFYHTHPKAIYPLFRRNEVLRFIEQGLYDLSITRTSFEWGIALPSSLKESKHVVYVWLDALLNYVSALGYGKGANLECFKHTIHVVGKDILRFHAIYWVAFLMSLELPLFERLCVHGWWTIDGVKMSKSLGNVLDAQDLAKTYGTETLRYFLLREVPLGQDGDFSLQALIRRSNADLSNTLGNLVQRVLGMASQYFGGKLESEGVLTHYAFLYQQLQDLLNSLDQSMQEMQPHRYLEDLWKIFEVCNATIAQEQPWNMVKTQPKKTMALLSLIATILAKSTFYLYPVMPESATKLAAIFGVNLNSQNFLTFKQSHYLLPPLTLHKIEALFPKIELETSIKQEQKRLKIEDFSKLEIRVGTVIKAEKVPKSSKLLCLQVDFGLETRQILSGIAKYYKPEELIGKQVCALVNLEPKKMLGLESEGMILTAGSVNHLKLIAPIGHINNGAHIE
ncbi:methionine--tRNA ligase [Helicobacter suis]|uniref:methionine--tRNA ligase n=1 Tax=Helicobacter suis TaxID=104628 RepID=UPI001F22CEEC|nr:methionine--tRNA ligase [Helicobacter suis]